MPRHSLICLISTEPRLADELISTGMKCRAGPCGSVGGQAAIQSRYLMDFKHWQWAASGIDNSADRTVLKSKRGLKVAPMVARFSKG